MTLNEYQVSAQATAQYSTENLEGLFYTTMGLAAESGEVLNKVKKVLRDTKKIVTPETRAALRDELGDMLWYVASTAHELGRALEDLVPAIHTGNARPITLNDYQRWAKETTAYPTEVDGLFYSAMTLGTEGGKAVDHVKHLLCRPQRILTDNTRVPLQYALANAFRWTSIVASQLGFTLEEIGVANLHKLGSRRERGVIAGSGDTR